LNFHLHLRLVGVHVLTVAAFPAPDSLSIVIAASTEPRNGNSNLTKNSDRHHRPEVRTGSCGDGRPRPGSHLRRIQSQPAKPVSLPRVPLCPLWLAFLPSAAKQKSADSSAPKLQNYPITKSLPAN